MGRVVAASAAGCRTGARRLTGPNMIESARCGCIEGVNWSGWIAGGEVWAGWASSSVTVLDIHPLPHRPRRQTLIRRTREARQISPAKRLNVSKLRPLHPLRPILKWLRHWTCVAPAPELALLAAAHSTAFPCPSAFWSLHWILSDSPDSFCPSSEEPLKLVARQQCHGRSCLMLSIAQG